MEDEGDVVVQADVDARSASEAAAAAPEAHAEKAPAKAEEEETTEEEEEETVPRPAAENNNAKADSFDSFPVLVDTGSVGTVEIPAGSPPKRKATVEELEEVMEEIAIESNAVDQEEEEEKEPEAMVAEKREERSTVAPQADTPLQQLHSALAAAKEQQEREREEKRQREEEEEPVHQQSPVVLEREQQQQVQQPAAAATVVEPRPAAAAAAIAEKAQTAQGGGEVAPSSLPRQLLRTTVILSSDEKPAETFARLAAGMRDGSIPRNVVVDTIFNVLVAGAFDMEARFTIDDAANIERMLQLLQMEGGGDTSFQAEVWSVFVAVVRKSIRNVEMCSRVGLISRLLDLLQTAPALLSDIYLQLVALVGQYSITVKETKRYLRALKVTEDGRWRRNSLRLVDVMRTLPKQDSTDVFFSFPGTPGAGIFLPPLRSFPYQAGWTFAAWVRMDPPNGTAFEKEKPVIYNFRSSKGASYSCNIVANFLVISVDKGKAGAPVLEKCVRTELRPRRWHHIALSHNYSRWGTSQVACYVDGHLADTVELN